MMDQYQKDLESIEMSKEHKDALVEALTASLEDAQGVQGVSSVKKRAKRSAKAAILLAACLALGGGAAYGISSHSNFFSSAFGNGWRVSETAMQVDYDGSTVFYPNTDVVEIDQETADRLLGNATADIDLTFEAPDGHVLTIDRMVRSENAAVYRFTLHKDGGVTALSWDEHADRALSACPSENCLFTWNVGDNDEIYIDHESSTDDTLYGYGYTVFATPLAAGKPVPMTAETAGSPHSHDWDSTDMSIGCTQTVATRSFTNDFGTIEVSPIDMTISCNAKDGYSIEDPGNVTAIKMTFEDGSTYTVEDDESNTDNTLSGCGWDEKLCLAFNRAIDPKKISEVEFEVSKRNEFKARSIVFE